MNITKYRKHGIVRYAVAAVFSIASTALLYVYQREYYGNSLADIYTMLCNAFFITGVLFISVGLLVIIGRHGNFIGLQFVLKQAGQFFINFFTGRYKRLDYISYKIEQEAKGEEQLKEPGKWRVVIIGLVNLIISLILLKMYYSL